MKVKVIQNTPLTKISLFTLPLIINSVKHSVKNDDMTRKGPTFVLKCVTYEIIITNISFQKCFLKIFFFFLSPSLSLSLSILPNPPIQYSPALGPNPSTLTTPRPSPDHPLPSARYLTKVLYAPTPHPKTTHPTSL